MAASPGGLVAPQLGFRIRKARTWPPSRGPPSLEIRRGKLQVGTRCCCSGSEIAKTVEEWRPLEARNDPRRVQARAMPEFPFPFARSKGLSKQKVYYPRCNNPRNIAPQSHDTPPKRDSGIASEKDWGINLLDEHVNESGINEDCSTWYRESGEEHGDNGYKCRWHKMGGQSQDGSSEWKEAVQRKVGRKLMEMHGGRHGKRFFIKMSGDWSRTWGEEHHGNGKVHKYGKSTAGESWDIVGDVETYYEYEPHYGWPDVVGDSTQLLSIKPMERLPGVFPNMDFGSTPPRAPGPPDAPQTDS